MLRFSFERRHVSLTLLTCIAVLGVVGFVLPGLLIHPAGATPNTTLYTDCNYLGGTFTFSGNVPDFTQYGSLNDAVSSLRVPAGYVVILYQDINYQGNPTQAFTSDTSCLTGSSIGNDNASSMTIYPIGQGVATLYSDCNFVGGTWTFSGTVPDFTQTSGLNDVLSSFRVPVGYIVILFGDINFKGNAETFGQDNSCLVGSKIGNDQASSMIVMSVPRPTSWNRINSVLGEAICNHYWGNCHSPPSWDAGYMDQDISSGSNPLANAVSVLVAFPGTGSAPGGFVPAGDYLALGMIVESQTNSSGSHVDLANIAMVYLTNSGLPMIIGEVWGFDDGNPFGSPTFEWGGNWICDCFTSSNFQNLVTLTMSWSGNNLNWQATIGGVQYSLFSYARMSIQEKQFHVGTHPDIICGCTNEWFQFGAMANYAPGGGWSGYVGRPRYLSSVSNAWTDVERSTWIGDQGAGTVFRAQLDHYYGPGAKPGGPNQGDSCSSGGSFPGTSQSPLFGQVVIHSIGVATSSHGLWDSNCRRDFYTPGASFVGNTPADGSWQNGQFSASMSNFDTGPTNSGVALCFWSVESLGGSWVTTLSPQLVSCNSTQTITVGGSGYCRYQGLGSCRLNAWSEDYLGNIGGTTTMIPSDGDSYTEGNSGSWQMTAGGSTVSLSDDTGTVIAGSRSVKGTWSGGADIVQLNYPRTGALSLNIASLGTNPVLRLYLKANPTTSSLDSAYLSTTDNDGFNSPSFTISDSNWHLYEWTVGDGGQFTRFGNGDWTRINSIHIHTDYAPGFPTSGSVWVDGLSFLSVTALATRYFSIDTVPPSAPGLVSPSNGASVTTDRPTFSWTSSTDASSGIASYTLQIDTLSSFNSGNLRRYTGLTGTSYTPSPLSFGGWYWQVIAYDNAGNFATSSTWQFTVAPFTLSASPTSVVVSPGATAASTITVSSLGGFTGTVTLSASTSPSTGLTCSLTPASITLGSSGTSTLSCSGSAATYTVTVMGTSGSSSQSASVTVIVLYSFRDDFSYASLNDMTGAGWTLCGTQSQVAVGGGVLALTNNGVTAGDMCWNNIPAGVTMWTVTDRGQYAVQLDGCVPPNFTPPCGGTWLSVQTASHVYQWDLDGYYHEYFLFRDGVQVVAVPGYTPQLGAWHDLTMDMRNGVLSLIADGKVITTYTETSNNNVLTMVTMMPGWETVTKYDFVTTTQVNPSQLPDFIVGVSPIYESVLLQATATSTINLSSLSGFTGIVTLSFTISPAAGLSCSLGNASVVLSNSNSTSITCTGSGGSYNITLTGTSGTLSHSTTLNIDVRDFSLGTPSTIFAAQGSSGPGTITLASLGGFTGSVALSVSGLPAGATSTLNPAQVSLTSNSQGTSTLTISVGTTVPTGSYTITGTGTGGGLSHSSSITLKVVLSSFSTTSTSTFKDITVTVTNNLVVNTATSDTLTGTATVQAVNGTTGITVSAFVISLNLPFDINGNLQYSFEIPRFPHWLGTSCFVSVVTASSSCTTVVSADISHDGRVDIVDLATVSGAFGCSQGMACYRLAADLNEDGTINIIDLATVSSQFGSTYMFLPPASPSINPAYFTVVRGASTSSTFIVTSFNGFSATLTLSVSSTPAGPSCTIPSSLTLPAGGSANVTVTCSTANAPGGVYTVTVTGTSGSLTITAPIVVSVQDFTMSAVPNAITIFAGSNGGVQVNINSVNGFTGTVNLSLSVSPSTGLVCSISPTSVTLGSTNSTTLTCNQAVGGAYTVSVTGTSGSLSHNIVVTVNVADFTISANPSTVTMNAQSTTTVNIVVTANAQWGYWQVYLTATGPAGTSYSFNTYPIPNPGQTLTSIMTITASSSAVAGNYTITVTGMTGSLQHSVLIPLTLRDYSISASPSTVNFNKGGSGSSTLTLTSLNGFSGTVTISAPSPSGLTVTCPSTLTLPSRGTATGNCTFSSSTPGTYSVTVTAASSGVIHTATIAVNVGDFSVSPSPSSITVIAGTPARSTITLSSLYNFAGTVTLSSSVSPSGLTTSLSPTSVTLSAAGTGSSTLTVSSLTVATYTVTVTGTSGSISHTTTVTVSVVISQVAADSATGPSSMGTGGAQKLIQDSAGKLIVVYVDSSGRIALSYANSDPAVGGWSTPVKSATPTSPYARPSAVLVSLTSLRIITEGGSAAGTITDIPVTISRDAQNNITGFTFGTTTTLDSSGLARYPSAVLAHNGNILLAWAWKSSTSSQIRALKWNATGWRNFAGTSSTPDNAIVDNSSVGWMIPSTIERPDNYNAYILANRLSGPPETIAFNKASWSGSAWTLGTQNLNYETNASSGVEDPVTFAWDPVRSVVVVGYGITGTKSCGVFTLNSADTKTHMDSPSFTITERDWCTIAVQATTGDYYLFLINANSDGGSGTLNYARMPSGGSWSSTLTVLDPGTDNQGLNVRATGTSATLDLVYVKGTAAPAKVRFVRLNP